MFKWFNCDYQFIYLPPQEEFENLCLTELRQWIGKLWPLVHVTLNRLYAIKYSANFCDKEGSRGITYPAILFLSSWLT